jgi:replicative DNA helicase
MTTDTWQHTVSDIERIVLSACIRQSNVDDVFAGNLKSNTWSDTRHTAIFKAIRNLYDNNCPIDLPLLKNELITQRTLDAAGGEEYVHLIADIDSPVTDFKHHIHIIFEASARREMKLVGQKLVSNADEVNLSVANIWQNSLDQLLSIEKNVTDSKKEVFLDTVNKIIYKALQRNNSAIPDDTIFTGFKRIDNCLNGFQPGELIVLAGRPAMGMTSFALEVVDHVCSVQKRSVGFISIEMSKEMLTLKLLTKKTKIDSLKISKGDMSEEERKALVTKSEDFAQYPLHIIDSSLVSPNYLRIQALKLKRQHNIDLLVVDNLQMIGSRQVTNYNRDQEMSLICRTLKGIARELNIPVLVTSQLNRAVETRCGDKRPILSDLRDSGTIEQTADKVLFLYRAEYYGIETDCDGYTTKEMAEVIIAKNRMGPITTQRLRFINRYATFKDVEEYAEEGFNYDLLAEQALMKKINSLFNEDSKSEFDDISPPF